MFDCIPPELELYIWRIYYNSEIIPYIKSIKIEKNTKENYRLLIPFIIDYSIKEKAARIINSIISKEIIRDPDNLESLDLMYYNLVNVHKNDLFDIFTI